MVINININIQPFTHKLSDGLLEAIKIINEISTNSPEDSITIDCSAIRFSPPLFALALTVFFKSGYIPINLVNQSSYLQTIHFFNGIHADDIETEQFTALMDKYRHKTYIPIISFSRSQLSQKILTTIENIIKEQIHLQPNMVSGLKYMLGEYTDNILEHSHATKGYIMAQSYPKKQYIDICIADDGITLLGSYQRHGFTDISSDAEAIQAANKGFSTKNLPCAENRGFGIRTSKEMLIKGLDGHFIIMMSGQCLHVYNSTENHYIELPPNISWKGTIIALRIPYCNSDFQYLEYVE